MLRRIALMLAFALPAASWAQTLSETLPNGLKIIVKEDHRAPVAVSQIWYKIGSVDEKPGKSGLSHALEHMMFKGTKDVPSGEFNRRVSELGGQNNAYTNRNETVYYEKRRRRQPARNSEARSRPHAQPQLQRQRIPQRDERQSAKNAASARKTRPTAKCGSKPILPPLPNRPCAPPSSAT